MTTVFEFSNLNNTEPCNGEGYGILLNLCHYYDKIVIGIIVLIILFVIITIIAVIVYKLKSFRDNKGDLEINPNTISTGKRRIRLNNNLIRYF